MKVRIEKILNIMLLNKEYSGYMIIKNIMNYIFKECEHKSINSLRKQKKQVSLGINLSYRVLCKPIFIVQNY